jgi:hypothetical protein
VSAASSAASSGAVLGIVLVFLAQQFGYLALTGIVASVIYFAVAAIVGGVVFGVAARAAGRRPAPPA